MKTIDLCIRISSIEDLEKIVNSAKVVGYRGLGVEVLEKNVEWGRVVRIGEKYGIELYRRLTLRARNRREMLRELGKKAASYDVIAVRSTIPDVIRHAARDGRVNLVSISPLQARYVDKSQAMLLKQGGGAVEVFFRDFIEAAEKENWRKMRGFEAALRRAAAFNIPIVVSSCASKWWQLVHPRILMSVLVSLGIPERIAKIIVYLEPSSVLRERKTLLPNV